MRLQRKSFLSASVRAAMYGTTALLAAATSHHALAQTADEEAATDDVTEVIEIKGIRGALASAAEIKREASTFVDSITASDASALPDLSVAEALSRIPGLTVTRFTSGGSEGDFPSPEGSGNLIRGLGFIRSEFNGRDAFSANGGRALDWSAVPPQLIGRVDVYKNQSADLIDGGIGGTINLQTLEPFDNQDGVGIITVDTIYTDLREEWSPTYSGIFGKNFTNDNGKFGFVASFSSSELASDINGYQSGAPNPRTNIPSDAYADPSQAADNVAIVPGFQMRTNKVDRDRDSLYFAGQWRSADSDMEVLFKYVTVENNIESIERTTEWFPDANNVGRTELSELVVSPFTSGGIATCNGNNESPVGACDELVAIDGGLMEQGIVSDSGDSWFGAYGLQVSNLGIGKQEYSKTDDVSLNLKWRPTDQLFVEFDTHRTTAEASFQEQWIGSNTYLNVFTRPDLDDPRLEFFIDPRHSFNPNQVQDGGDVQNPYSPTTNTDDPGGYFLPFANDGFRDGEGDLFAVKLDAEYEFEDEGWFDSVKVGTRYSERDQLNREAGTNWRGVSQPWIGGGLTPLDAFDTEIHEVVDFSDFFRGGVISGDNTSFVYVDERFLRDPNLFYDFIINEPDLAQSQYSPFVGFTNLYDDAGMLNMGGENARRDENFNKIYQPGDISDVVEEQFNLYAMAKFSQDFDNGMYIEGNLGLRYVKTSLSSDGFLRYAPFGPDADDTLTNPLYTDEAESRDSERDFLPETTAFLETGDSVRTVDVDEDHWLPSLNIKLNLNDDMLIRFGASKGITRPNIQDLRADQTIFANTSRVEFDPLPADDPNAGIPRGAQDISLQRLNVNGGNPDLKATEAINLDISYEWYFENGFFTFGVFNKDIKNIIQYGAVPQSQITLDGQTVNFNFNGNNNIADADITGFEIAYQDFFTELPGLWQHFGLQANYTFVDASATPPPQFLDANDDGVPDSFDSTFRFGLDNLLGQSEHTGNLIGIYQDDALEVRLIYNYRSEYLNSYRDFVTGNPIFQKGTSFVDASVRYSFTDNLTLNVLVANITDEKSQSETQIDAAGQRYQRSSFINDRRLQVGLSYKF
ncbi:TonB-dependent receptor [Glaciecola sp. MH2013]|uniref:TonB-dependent receptor n=1 Tax=Glaciecola sp. MH2013 TaxID=2785524 RepID=UPI00189EA4C9|nr:TonB-dependent receptor [Glaciecola sp. MH2013]MBF7072317.1 TonB-dependent receptor [Glaciecola sp. MH2013]